MPALYMDEHVPSAVTDGLRLRGIEVLTVQADGFNQTDDPLIDRALALGRLMFAMDTDFLIEEARRQIAGEEFATVVFAPQEGPSIGKMIADLEYLALAAAPTDMTNGLHYLPL